MSFNRRVLSALGNGRGLEMDVTSRIGLAELRDALAKSKRAKLDAIVQEIIERAFARRYAIKKNGKKPDAKLVLPFRGAQ